MTDQELKDLLIRTAIAIARKRGINIMTDHKFRQAAAVAAAARLAKAPLTFGRGRPKI